MGKWFFGVSGGLKENDTSCGCVICHPIEFVEGSTVQLAKDIVKQYISRQNQESKAGYFLGFVLLSDKHWNINKIQQYLKKDWNIEIQTKDSISNQEQFVVNICDHKISLTFIDQPVPHQEVLHSAANNYMWRDAVEVTKQHQAHIIVSVIADQDDIIEGGELFVKIVASCCKLVNALGFYTNGVVYESCNYIESAQMLHQRNNPIFNWVWFGIYRNNQGICCYTEGLESFGYEEMEIFDEHASPINMYKLLINIVVYIFETGDYLRDFQTIDLEEEGIYTITLKNGMYHKKEIINIDYHANHLK